MSESVWLVTKGAYSDYQVIAVCPTEAAAVALTERLNRASGQYDECNDPKEVPFVGGDVALTEVVGFSYTVHVDSEGVEIRRASGTTSLGACEPMVFEQRTTWAGYDGAVGYSNRSYAEALKAARDFLAKRKAEREDV